MIPREHWPQEDNWDGYGAAATTEAAMVAAESVAFVPTVVGGFQIEIFDSEIEVEIEFDEEGKVQNVMFEKL